MSHFDNTLREELQALRNNGNFRSLPRVRHNGRTIVANGNEMLDLSSNDYLGVANNLPLRESFVRLLTADNFIPSASSSRLLTGTFAIHRELEEQLAALFGTEAALVLSSGYHANTGILPAISNSQTLILADKLVHASLIDGMRLSAARCIRYRHNDMEQLSRLVDENCDRYERVIIATESIFSMDGDEADLPGLVRLKRNHPNLLLYVDEAHAFGVRGETGLGCAEEQPGAVAAPAGMRLVAEPADDRVIDGVPDAGYQHQGRHGPHADTEDVRIEDHQEVADKHPAEITSHIAHAVSQLAHERDSLLFRFACHTCGIIGSTHL